MPHQQSANRWLTGSGLRGAAYDQRFDRLAEAGVDVHGEATLVESLGARSVLDAGCGTGRVAIELARRGCDVVGVDLDDEMLRAARARAPELTWILDDLATVDVGRHFDLVVLAGNVMIFLAPGDEATVVANLARHLRPSGLFLTGFSLGRGDLTLAEYDDLTDRAGLALQERWSTWDRRPYDGGDYAVSLHGVIPAPGGLGAPAPGGLGAAGPAGRR